MNLNELEMIPIIKLYGSYAEASRATGVPISTLSKWVSRVEGELGVDIFERKTYRNSVSLTEAGKVLLPLIQKMVNTNSFMFKQVEYLQASDSNSLTVGIPATLSGMGVAELMADYQGCHPKLDVISVFQSHDDLLRLLVDGMVECIFVTAIGDEAIEYIRGMFSEEQYEIAVVNRSRELYIGISAQDPLSERKTLGIEDLKYQCFIFNKWHDMGRRNARQGASFFEFLYKKEEDCEVIYEDFINRNYIFSLVARGTGVLPQIFLPKRMVPGVRFVPLAGWNQTSNVLFAARKFGSSQLRDFTKYVKKKVSAGVD